MLPLSLSKSQNQERSTFSFQPKRGGIDIRPDYKEMMVAEFLAELYMNCPEAIKALYTSYLKMSSE